MRYTSRRVLAVSRSFAAFVTLLSLLGGPAGADPIYRDDTVAGDTNWFTAANWHTGSLPTDSDEAFIGDTGYLTPAIVDIAAPGAVADTLTLGNDTGSSGTLRLLLGGSLSVTGNLNVGGEGTGALVQTGGSLLAPYLIVQDTFSQTGGTASAEGLGVVNWRGGQAQQTLGPGTLTTGYTVVGMAALGDPDVPGSGRFEQTGGTHAVLTSLSGGGGSLLGVGFGTGGTGAYSLSSADALLQAPSTLVGFLGGNGTFTHTAGTHLITSDSQGAGSDVGFDLPGLFLGFGLAEDPDAQEEGSWIGYPSTGSYALTGGTLTITRVPSVMPAEPPLGAVVWLGTSGTGTLLLGDANGTGTLNEADPPQPTGDEVGVSLLLRPMPFEGGDTATLRGWGTPSLTGVLLNNGRVIADGYGQDRDLDLRGFSLVTSAAGIEGVPLLQGDGTQAGWYAQGHGRLLLPTCPTPVEGGWIVAWGTAPLDGEESGIPVNALLVLLDGLQEEPPLFSIALLAPDHGGVPAGTTGSILGIWDIQMDGELPEGTEAGLAIRYDDALAGTLGLDEDDLGLFHFTNGQWYDITSGLDTENHVITGSWDMLSPFAVGSNIRLQQQGAIPEPATLTLLALGGLTLLRRRRRRPSA